MSGWATHTGTAIALDRESIDTDQLIPARFMSTPRAEGYGRFLLHDQRVEADGSPMAEAPLNRHPSATVLVTRRNFGSGSSREAAVYALVDFGITAVLAPSFGDIFASNAVNNGLLPAQIDSLAVDGLIEALGCDSAPVEIDLQKGRATLLGRAVPFALDPVWREKLINGWDDIDLTQAHREAIAADRRARATNTPWAFPKEQAVT